MTTRSFPRWFGRAALATGLLFACGPPVLPPVLAPIPAADVTTSIFLIGDAGAVSDSDPVLVELTREAKAAPRESAIVYLGDNVYPRGMPPPEEFDRASKEHILERQIAVAKQSGVPAYFIPGNHDWARMTREGWDAVRRSETFIKIRGEGLAQQAPRNGCPGPEVVDVGKSIRLVLLDTQWWLQRADFPRPIDSVSTCVQYSQELILARLKNILADSGGRRVIVAATPSDCHQLRAQRVLHPPAAHLSAPGLQTLDVDSSAPDRVSIPDGSGSRRLRVRPGHGLARLYPYAQRDPPGPRAPSTHAVCRWARSQPSGVSGPGGGLFGRERCGHHWTRESGRLDRSTIYAVSRPGFIRVDVDRSGRVRLTVTAIDHDGSARQATAIWLTDAPSR